MNRRAYFFLMDAIFALVILMIGFMIISSSKPTETDDIPLALAAENFMDIMASVKLNEICYGCECSIQDVQQQCNNGDILNMDQSMLDYLGELYYLYDEGDILKRQELIDVFTGISDEIYREDLYGVELIIDNRQMYIDGDKINTPNLITSKRVLFGYIENSVNGQVTYWGPYSLEVNFWEK
ncbi:hypothetical protein HN789_06740 [archaeon]|nr:hypothetical protein [archaeon]MBT4022738.1 hypothetical protein [archaeon]MBT4273068.1 hypothetical protein [archaeon]MBT4461049.1 hypothetical protein [archaeon]MBT4858057.1 hypothetical protein [archaeon]